MNPLLTSIIPCYNDAATLEACLVALFTQDASQRVIVVEDGGELQQALNVKEIVERYAPNYSVGLVSIPHSGVAIACNLGFTYVTTPYVRFCSANDQVWGPIGEVYEIMKQHPEAAMCCGRVRFHDVRLSYLKGNWGPNPMYLTPDDFYMMDSLLYKDSIQSASVIYRTSMFPGWPINLGPICDFYVINKLAFTHGMCYVPHVMAQFLYHKNSSFQRARRDKAEWKKLCKALVSRLAFDIESGKFPREAAQRLLVSQSLAENGMEVFRTLYGSEFNHYCTADFYWRCWWFEQRRRVRELLRKLGI